MNRKKLALLLVGNTVALVTLYFVLTNLGAWYITPIYLALAAVIGIGFVVYNRGFVAKNATPDDLPNTMTREEKRAFLQDGKERLARSRWVITLLFPLVAAILLDMLYLYIYPYLETLFV